MPHDAYFFPAVALSLSYLFLLSVSLTADASVARLGLWLASSRARYLVTSALVHAPEGAMREKERRSTINKRAASQNTNRFAISSRRGTRTLPSREWAVRFVRRTGRAIVEGRRRDSNFSMATRPALLEWLSFSDRAGRGKLVSTLFGQSESRTSHESLSRE